MCRAFGPAVTEGNFVSLLRVESHAMARTLRWLMVAVLLIAPSLPLGAETVKQLPAPTGYVNDFAGVISPEARQSLEDLCTQVDRQAHAQIAIVTVKTIEDDSGGETTIEEFATKLEEKWKVGAKGTDRGILMLFVMTPAGSTTPKDRIEVGYGLEGILPDGKVGDIRRDMIPLAQQGQYGAAILLGTREIAQVIATDAGVSLDTGAVVHHYHREGQQQAPWSLWQMVVVGGIVLVIFLVLVATGHVGMAFWLLFNLMGGGGGGGRDDDRGGGGFGGFGGGSSGGGGASGDF
jgi:uncharacterized protein